MSEIKVRYVDPKKIVLSPYTTVAKYKNKSDFYSKIPSTASVFQEKRSWDELGIFFKKRLK